MIIDTCIFAGELEMLRFRIAILSPVVDHFVVVESAWTHQGKPRQKAFFDSTDTIHSFYIDIYSDDPHQIEAMQRDAIRECCSQFNDDDLVILSDVDEIPSRESVEVMRTTEMPRDCELDFFYYRLNWMRPEKCSLILSTIKHLREVGGQQLRALRGSYPSIGVKPSGWHLSYFGGTKAIQQKLSTFVHSEFNKPEFTNEEWLEECQREGIALLKCGTPFTKVGRDHFPQYFVDAAPKGWWL